MTLIKCIRCGSENEAKKELTSGLKLKVLTSICGCGQVNIEYKDKYVFIPKETGILNFKP